MGHQSAISFSINRHERAFEAKRIPLSSKTEKDFSAISCESRIEIPHHQFEREFLTVARTRIPLSQAEENQRELEERLELSTAQIGLTVRTTNCLEEKGIFTVKDLLKTTPNELLGITNFGEKTLEEVYQSLSEIGFHRGSSSLAPR